MKAKVHLIAAILIAPPLMGALSACRQPPVMNSPMTLQDCRKAKKCVIRGTLSVVQLGEVMMGKLMLPEGECLSVSLPSSMVDSLVRSGPRQETVAGTIFPVPDDIEVATIAVNGRQIGLGQCGNLYLYVP